MLKKMKKLVALLLVLSLSLSFPAYAVEAETQTAEETEAVRVAEVESLRETNSETYLMSDGTYQCVVYAEDKYYLDDNDTLQVIDNTIVLETASADASLNAVGSAAASGRYKNAANAFDVSFSGSGIPEVSMAMDGNSVAFSPLTASGGNTIQMNAVASPISVGAVNDCAALGQLTATGSNTVTYENAFANTDLVYVLENGALKEYIILRSSNASSQFSFLFTLNGLTLETVDDNAYLTDGDGNIVFALSDLFAIDANGVITEDLSYSFTPVKGTDQIIVTVILDESYLLAADRTFPVIIDPSITISSVETMDACVCSYYPTTNYRTAYQLRTGMDTDYGIRRSYIKFDIPDSVPIYGVQMATLEIERVSGSDPTVRAYQVTGAWDSSTIKWNNKPSYTTVGYSTQSGVQSNGTWCTMYVTDTVKAWVNGASPNYGFVLIDGVENDPDHWTTFYSSDASSPHKPELNITYNSVVVDENDITVPYTSVQYIPASPAGRIFVYPFTPSHTDTYSIWTTGITDTTLRIYTDTAFSTPFASATSGGHSTNACKTLTLSAGREYYIVVSGATTSTTGAFTLQLSRGLPMSGSEKPSYFNYYNDSTYIEYNNCYTYILGTWVNPVSGNKYGYWGRNPGGIAGSAISLSDLASASVAKNAIVTAVKKDCQAWGGSESDFYEVDADEMVPEGFYKVALVLDPGQDYHWYRQVWDHKGQWAHKPGITAATLYDSSGELIFFPENADRGNYTEFLGYFALKPPSAYETSAVSSTSDSLNLNETYAYNTSYHQYEKKTDILLSQFLQFVANESTCDDVQEVVGKAHETWGSGFIWDVYYTSDNHRVEVLYKNDRVEAINLINAQDGTYETIVS